MIKTMPYLTLITILFTINALKIDAAENQLFLNQQDPTPTNPRHFDSPWAMMLDEVDDEDLSTNLKSNSLSSKPISMCFEQSFAFPAESYDESIETSPLRMFSGFVFNSDSDFFKIETSSSGIYSKRIVKKNLNLLTQKKSLSLSILVILKESANHHVWSHELQKFKTALSNKIKIFRLFK